MTNYARLKTCEKDNYNIINNKPIVHLNVGKEILGLL